MVRPDPRRIDANQAAGNGYAAAPQVQQSITVDQAPAFVTDSPPLAVARRPALAPGASGQLPVTITAARPGRARLLDIAESRTPDPRPRNNTVAQTITITHHRRPRPQQKRRPPV